MDCREIKFRVWNTAVNSFLDLNDGEWGYYYITLDGKFMVHYNKIGLGDNPLGKAKDEHLSYMLVQQYTGVKDQFDKEIYEGDIIESGVGRRFIVEWTFLSFQFREIEKLKDGKMYMDRVVSYMGDIKTSCRVIGNIFENPELLK